MKSPTFRLGLRDPLALSVWIVALCLVAAVAAGCGGDGDATKAVAGEAAATDQASGATSQAAGDDGSGEASRSSAAVDGSGEASRSAAADDTVAATNQNPSGAGPELDYSRNTMLRFAAPRNAVTWTTAPHIADGALSGAGELPQGVTLFDPMSGGAPFSVRVAGHDEPMVVLLPDLGPMQTWNTSLTVAEMELELSGTSFSFTAYSPLFMDVSGADLEFRVYGFDVNGSIALLAVAEIAE